MLCACGSQIEYSSCCEPYITGKLEAPTAEALMRSRYTAHVVAVIPYLKKTLAPEARKNFNEQEVRAWATNSEWLGLKIVTAREGASEATVEFIATYKSDEKVLEHHEVAQFKKASDKKRWFFVEGEARVLEQGQDQEEAVTTTIVREGPKIGRNDPCHCGSGKKYKKCHLEEDEAEERKLRQSEAARVAATAVAASPDEKPAYAKPSRNSNFTQAPSKISSPKTMFQRKVGGS